MPLDSSSALKTEKFTGALSVVKPIMSTSELCLWIVEIEKEVQSLKKMPENWDSYGSSAIANTASEKVEKLLPLLARLGMSKPNLFPVSGGGLQLEWEKDDRELEIEILPNGTIEYLKVFSDGKMEEGKAIDEDIFSLAKWFNENRMKSI